MYYKPVGVVSNVFEQTTLTLVMSNLQTTAPEIEFHREDTTFSVYCAKQFFSDDWESSELRDLVEQARETYRIYSPTIPCFDSYDAKSAVYLVRAQYPIEYLGDTTLVNEWVTLRFVPAWGTPLLSEDLKHYTVDSAIGSRSLVDQIGERLFEVGPADAVSRLYTYSRFCASRPAAEDENQQWLVNAYWQAAGIRTKNRWTAVAFALMNTLFLDQVRQQHGDNYLAITAQINEKVERTVFLPGLQQVDPQATLMFPFAYQVLQFDSPARIYLNRAKYSEYFYRFPGYFFKVPELVAALAELVHQGKLAVAVLEQYLDQPWTEVVHNPNYQHLHRMGELLTAPQTVSGLPMSSVELRQFLDQRVSDGVQLRLVTQSFAQNRCAQLLASVTKKEF